MVDARTQHLPRSPGRRATDQLPDEWIAARPVLELRLDGVEESVINLTHRIGAMADDVHVMRDRQGWMLAVAAVIFAAIVSGVGYLMTRYIVTAMESGAAAASDARIEMIAETLEQTDLPKNRDGTPRLSALRAALPEVPGIKRRERAAACLRVPGACEP